MSSKNGETNSGEGGERTFVFNKLVRDGIVADTERRGGRAFYIVLEGSSIDHQLRIKMTEEPIELGASNGDREAVKGELADLLELIHAYARRHDLFFDEIENARIDKLSKIGGFSLGHYLILQTLPGDDPLVSKYEADPDRYPESHI